MYRQIVTILTWKVIRQLLKLHHWKVLFLNYSCRQAQKKKVQTTSFQDALLDSISNPPLYFQTPPEVDDPDKAFLFSFLPNIKK
ncbi:hypothetical protein FWK35_00039133 [Aphis craccivora]|uniref:Uncharacterized protein n=1 Tax=Aphis craccivora TaxID=307492 RepID=A0A6G0VJ00_APHCR|nr:hypothetical protein FWK35_00039133 [Aphis craccivora]